MKLSQESLLGLKRHFLGALSEPSPVWIVPAPGPKLLLTSDGDLRISPSAFVVDFGTVESPGEERRTLRVINLDQETLLLKVRNPNPWLTASWLGNGGGTIAHLAAGRSDLELVAAHDFLEEKRLAGSVELLAETLSGSSLSSEIQVRLAATKPHPVGLYDFQGSAKPESIDFGLLDPAASGPEAAVSYSFSFQNMTSVPLVVSFADLPAWLVFEVDGHQRRGPAAGRFFERPAPFQAEVRPVRTSQFLGLQRGRLRLTTNDFRPDLQQVDLQLTATIEPSKPCVTVDPPALTRISPAESCWMEAVLANWGKTPARLSLKSVSPAIQIQERPVVPAARNGEPGRAALRIRVSSSQLASGPQSLPLVLHVQDGEPAEVSVPVWVNVGEPGEPGEEEPAAQPRSPVRVQVLVTAVLFLLLMLVFLVVFRDVLSG